MNYQEIADSLRYCAASGRCSAYCPRFGKDISNCRAHLNIEAADAIEELIARPATGMLTADGLNLLTNCPWAINLLADRVGSKLDEWILHGAEGGGG